MDSRNYWTERLHPIRDNHGKTWVSGTNSSLKHANKWTSHYVNGSYVECRTPYFSSSLDSVQSAERADKRYSSTSPLKKLHINTKRPVISLSSSSSSTLSYRREHNHSVDHSSRVNTTSYNNHQGKPRTDISVNFKQKNLRSSNSSHNSKYMSTYNTRPLLSKGVSNSNTNYQFSLRCKKDSFSGRQASVDLKYKTRQQSKMSDRWSYDRTFKNRDNKNVNRPGSSCLSNGHRLNKRDMSNLYTHNYIMKRLAPSYVLERHTRNLSFSDSRNCVTKSSFLSNKQKKEQNFCPYKAQQFIKQNLLSSEEQIQNTTLSTINNLNEEKCFSEVERKPQQQNVLIYEDVDLVKKKQLSEGEVKQNQNVFCRGLQKCTKKEYLFDKKSKQRYCVSDTGMLIEEKSCLNDNLKQHKSLFLEDCSSSRENSLLVNKEKSLQINSYSDSINDSNENNFFNYDKRLQNRSSKTEVDSSFNSKSAQQTSSTSEMCVLETECRSEKISSAAPPVEKSIANLLSRLYYSEESNKSSQDSSKSDDDFFISCTSGKKTKSSEGKVKKFSHNHKLKEKAIVKPSLSEYIKGKNLPKKQNKVLNGYILEKHPENCKVDEYLYVERKDDLKSPNIISFKEMCKEQCKNATKEKYVFDNNIESSDSVNLGKSPKTKLVQSKSLCSQNEAVDSKLDKSRIVSSKNNVSYSKETAFKSSDSQANKCGIYSKVLRKRSTETGKVDLAFNKSKEIKKVKNSFELTTKKNKNHNGSTEDPKTSVKLSSKSLRNCMNHENIDNKQSQIKENKQQLDINCQNKIAPLNCFQENKVIQSNQNELIKTKLQMPFNTESLHRSLTNDFHVSLSALEPIKRKSLVDKDEVLFDFDCDSDIKPIYIRKKKFINGKIGEDKSIQEQVVKLKNCHITTSDCKEQNISKTKEKKQTAKKSFSLSSCTSLKPKVLSLTSHANKIKKKNKKKYFRGGRYNLYLYKPKKKKKSMNSCDNDKKDIVEDEFNVEVNKEKCALKNVTDKCNSEKEVIIKNTARKSQVNSNLKMPLNEVLWSKLNKADIITPLRRVQTSRKTFPSNSENSTSILFEKKSVQNSLQDHKIEIPVVGVARKSVQHDRCADKSQNVNISECSEINCTPSSPVLQYNEKKSSDEYLDVVTDSSDPEIIFTDIKKKYNIRSTFYKASNDKVRVTDNSSVDLSKNLVAVKADIIKSTCSCASKPLNCVPALNGATVCQALDSVDEEVIGCNCNSSKSYLVRPSINTPYKAMCEVHFWRLRRHQCCPMCGVFCTQGLFLRCVQNEKTENCQFHFFHRRCLADLKSACPHCANPSKFENVQLVLNMNVSHDRKFVIEHDDKKLIISEANITSGITNYHISAISLNDERYNYKMLNRYLYVPNEDVFKAMRKSLSMEKTFNLRPSGKCLLGPIKANDVEKVLQVLANGVNPDHKFVNLEGDTPLHLAAAAGYTDVIHVLVQAGAYVNVVNDKLYTPLMVAVQKKHYAVAQYLIMAGSDLDAQDEDGLTCFHIATRAGDQNISKMLYGTGKIDINVQDDGGWTPVVWACEHKHVDTVKWLLEKGANPNIRDNECNIALHWAVYAGSVPIIKLLLKAGCNINAVNKHGDSALHIAAREDFYDCVVFLCSKGAVSNIKNEEDLTPLMCCPNSMSKTWNALKMYEELKRTLKFKTFKEENIILRDISHGKEFHPIDVVNDVDGEELDVDFHYITNNCESPNITINKIVKSMRYCYCEDGCSTFLCSCSIMSFKCWYDEKGCLVSEFNTSNPPAIFECNKMCHCSQNCMNRVVQHGTKCHLQLFRTIGKGWGVRTGNFIPKGTFICEYLGELITSEEVEERNDDSYLFDLDNGDGESYFLDAHTYGNISRFLNHSCTPNIVAVKVFINHHDLNFPHIAFFSTRDIKKNEELCFDYGENFWIVRCKSVLCACGSSSCKYSKDSIDETLIHYEKRLRGKECQDNSMKT